VIKRIVIIVRVDLYSYSITSLKKEDMLLKINANYKGKDLTVEDVVNQVQFLKKLKWPFLVLMVIVCVFQWVVDILKGLNIKHWFIVEAVFYVYCILR
jgi:hypothetical protein